MQKVIVNAATIGSCTIEYNETPNEAKEFTEKKELTIKTLAYLQIACITLQDNDLENLNNIIDTINNCINLIEHITIEDDNEFFKNHFN